MARRATSGEDRALAAFAQQLDAIKHRFAEVDQQQDFAAGVGAVPAPATVISIDQWGTLLNAVKARLRLAVGEAGGRDFNGTPASLRTTVVECVDALDLLHAALSRALSPDAQIDGRDSADTANQLWDAAQAPGSGVPVLTSPLTNRARAALAIN